MLRASLGLTLVLAALSRDAGVQPPQQGWRVGLRTFGPIRYGMTIDQLSAALGETVSLPDSECHYADVRALPAGSAVMTIQGRVERVDIDTVGILTRSNVGVGFTEDQVRQAYPGQIRTEPHPYTGPEGHYLIFQPRDPADTSFGIIFETDGKRVTRYRAGRQPAVGYIEGCS